MKSIKYSILFLIFAFFMNSASAQLLTTGSVNWMTLEQAL